MAHCCWPCLAGEVAERTGGSYLVDCFCGGILAFFYCANGIFWGPTRTRLRHKHNIPGSCTEDVVVTTCCCPCYLTQSLNHLDLADAAAKAAGQGQPPVAMVMRQPPSQPVVFWADQSAGMAKY